MILSRAALAVCAFAATAAADTTSGVDGALFRSSYDANGIFAVEGARLMPARDLSLKALVGYGRAPIAITVPGIGGATDADAVLDHLLVLDLAFGLSLSDRIALGIDVATYRAATGDGFGVRGRYASGGGISTRSTGLIALRPLTNIDPSATGANDLNDGLAGPLDARLGVKVALLARERVAITAVGSLFLPFGEDELLLGERDVVVEPKLAAEVRLDRVRATRLVANLAARVRKRSVLEGYDAADPATDPNVDARIMLDVGGELVIGLGGIYELSPRASIGGEVQLFAPFSPATYGGCRRYSGARCDSVAREDYVDGAGQGDFTALVTAGGMVRVSPDVTLTAMLGTSIAGARGDDLRVTAGLVWAPQVGGPATTSADRSAPADAEADADTDGIGDRADRCADEPEDKDGYQDDDGCPERDNDGDDVADTDDRCPDQREDADGFEDADGCPDTDNDSDGFADEQDRCPNDPETVNGIDDDDGCPDARTSSGPEERADRIDLKGVPIAFVKGTGTLTPASRRLLDQVAALIRPRPIVVRVEVHVALGSKPKTAAATATQRRKDKALAQLRAKEIVGYLATQGVPADHLTTVGYGSDRPLDGMDATSAQNDRVELVKVRSAP